MLRECEWDVSVAIFFFSRRVKNVRDEVACK